METKGKYQTNTNSNPSLEDIKTRLTNPETRGLALVDTAEWVKKTALYFGASPSTAYLVAGYFIQQLEKDLPRE